MGYKKKQNTNTQKNKKPVKTTSKITNEKKWWTKAALAIVVLLTFVAFAPSIDNDFVNWDDDWYVLENEQIRDFSIEKLTDLFSSFFHGQYSPVTTLLVVMNYSISGLSPLSYHITGLILHLINACLVFVFIRLLVQQVQLTSKPGAKLIIPFVTALLFGIHTLQVESAAWVAAQKVTLYTLFFLASLIAYTKFLSNNKKGSFIAAILFFILSFGSKEQAMVLPVVLVGIDFFYNRKLMSKTVIIEKIPFFVLSIIFGIVSLLSQSNYGAISDSQWFSFIDRIPFAAYGFLIYFVKIIFPYQLSGFYPFPVQVGQSAPMFYWLFVPISIAFIAFVIYSLKKGKNIFFAILFYSINIFLTLQIVSTGREVIIADRYAYIPSIGVFFLVGLGLAKLYSSSSKYFKPLFAVFIIWAAYLGGYTYQRTDVWQDGITFWSDVQQKNPKVHVAFYNRGNEWLAQEKFDLAIADYEKAIPLKPFHSGTYANMGVALAKSGKMKQALENYNKIAEIDSLNSEAYSNRGNAKAYLGDLQGALRDYNKAISIDSTYIDVYINRAVVRDSLGDVQGIIHDQTKIISMQPNMYRAYLQRGRAYTKQGKTELAKADFENVKKINPKILEQTLQYAKLAEANKDYKQAIDLYDQALIFAPNDGDLYFNNAMCYDAINKAQEAMQNYNKAIQINPKHIRAYEMQGVLFGKLGDFNRAISNFDKVVEIAPKTTSAYSNRGRAYVLSGNTAKGIADYSKAIEIDPKFITPYHNRALAYQRLNKTTLAINDFSSIIKLSPKDAGSYYQRALLYLKTNDKDAACSDLKKGTELGHQASKVEYNRLCGQ